jgi:hypothetical protein
MIDPIQLRHKGSAPLTARKLFIVCLRNATILYPAAANEADDGSVGSYTVHRGLETATLTSVVIATSARAATILMGASPPVIVRWIEATPSVQQQNLIRYVNS